MCQLKFRDLDDGLVREADAQSEAYSSKDFIIGLDAVKNRVNPKFQGW